MAADRRDAGEPRASAQGPNPRFEALYAAHSDFVWRSARRLGVREAALEDVVQEVFLTVHRKLPSFEGRSAPQTWICGILLHVVRAHMRTRRRKGRFFGWLGGGGDTDASELATAHGPHDLTERAQATRALHALLAKLDDDKRAVFVMVELEEMSVADAAAALDWNVNTTHTRLRAARRDFEQLAARLRATHGESGAASTPLAQAIVASGKGTS